MSADAVVSPAVIQSPARTSFRAGDSAWLWLLAVVWGPQYLLCLVPSIVFMGQAPAFMFVGFGLTTLMGVGAAALLYQLMQRVPAAPISRRIAVAVVAVCVVSAVHGVAARATLQWVVEHMGDGGKMPQAFWLDAIATALSDLTLFGIYLLAAELLMMGQRARAADRALAQARDDARQAQIAALRFQLNPHFLFNTLNAVSGLILTGRAEQAEVVVGRLSGFLRASLATDLDDLVTVAEEFDTIHAYLEIESARFGERLLVELDCAAAAAEALVPSLLVQPLVENAVKYAVAPSRRPVTVRVEAVVEAADLVLRVSDDGGDRAAAPPADGTGVGLKNVRGRLERFYGGRGALSTAMAEPGFVAEVRLPLQRAREDARRYA